MKDEEISPFLCGLRCPTFVTLDTGFYQYKLCHMGYCLVYMSIRLLEVATFLRRILRHPEFRTQAKRMGRVIRISHAGLSVRHLNFHQEILYEWIYQLGQKVRFRLESRK